MHLRSAWRIDSWGVENDRSQSGDIESFEPKTLCAASVLNFLQNQDIPKAAKCGFARVLNMFGRAIVVETIKRVVTEKVLGTPRPF